MQLYTMGFTKKDAGQFFGLIKDNAIQLLMDIRLNNASQLSGFTKGRDLQYFLREICGCAYVYAADFAPTKEMMDGFKSNKLSYEEFKSQYRQLIHQRESYRKFCDTYAKYDRICLLCSEPEADFCHRRLLAELLAAEFPQITVRHI